MFDYDDQDGDEQMYHQLMLAQQELCRRAMVERQLYVEYLFAPDLFVSEFLRRDNKPIEELALASAAWTPEEIFVMLAQDGSADVARALFENPAVPDYFEFERVLIFGDREVILEH